MTDIVYLSLKAIEKVVEVAPRTDPGLTGGLWVSGGFLAVSNGVAPIIDTQPQSQSIAIGGSVTFSVVSANALSYQWQRSDNYGSTWSNISGEVSASYTLTPVVFLANDQDQFRVVCTNGTGSTNSSAAILTVTETAPATYILLLGGESNIGGFALNTDLSSDELAVRTLPIFNPTAGAWQSLDIGTNNILEHTGLGLTTHGLEAALANLYDDGVFGSLDVRILKAGDGGSQMIQWTDGAETLRTRMFARTTAAAALVTAPVRYLFWWSQGINDSLGNSNPAISDTVWKAKTIQLFGEIRAHYGADMPIVCTELPAPYTAYNARLAEIATELSGVYIAETSDASMRDTNHWSAAGFKTICPRMLAPLFYHDATLRALGPVISTQPADTSVEEPNDAAFTVATSSLTAVTQQWQQSDDGTAFSNASGETATTITVADPTVADDNEDEYRVRVTALGRTRTSREAVLTVTAPVVFDPSVDLAAKLVGWWQADSLTYSDVSGGTTTPVSTNDSLVGTWVSKVGSTKASLTNPANRPLLKTAYENGKNAIYMAVAGSPAYFVTDGSLAAKDVIIVAKYNGATIASDFPCLFGKPSQTNPTVIGNATGGTTFFGSPFIASPYSLRINGAVSAAMPMNAAKIIEWHGATAVTGTFNIGHNSPTNSREWRGWIHEILILDAELTTEERTALNNYLAGRYGIAL